MAYYEIIIDNEFVGIATSADMIRFQAKHNIILSCDETKAEYVMCNETLYHADWMLPVNKESTAEYTDASVITIDEDTYNSLYSAIENNETIEVESEETTEDSTVYEEGEEVTLEYIINAKVNEMSATCNNVIIAGFDVTLSDNESHHFSLTTQDQLNLITLSSLVANGEEYVPYHADGELCKYYSAADIVAIVTAATSYKTYHTSYFNSLKLYIEDMKEIADVSSVFYGMEIPEEYQSDVLKQLIAAME